MRHDHEIWESVWVREFESYYARELTNKVSQIAQLCQVLCLFVAMQVTKELFQGKWFWVQNYKKFKITTSDYNLKSVNTTCTTAHLSLSHSLMTSPQHASFSLITTVTTAHQPSATTLFVSLSTEGQTWSLYRLNLSNHDDIYHYIYHNNQVLLFRF